MNVGPGGFGSAPITKAILVATGAVSVFLQATRGSHRILLGPVPPPIHLVAFTTPGELLFGAVLLYNFRLFERQSGSNKYGAYAFLVTSISYGLQLAVHHLLRLPHAPVSGPYGIIYASFVRFLLDVPPSSTFTVLGVKMSDKLFMYLAGLQLLLSSGRASLVAGACGVVAGLLYQLNFLGMKRLRPPAVVVNFLRRTVGALLSPPAQAPPRRPQVPGAVPPRPTAPLSAHAPAAAGSPIERRPAAPPPSAEAVQQLVGMGFPQPRALWALAQTSNDVQAAINLLLQ